MNRVSNIIIENARIGFRNFVGAAGKYNAAGNRNFCVFLEHDLGLELQEDGWNIRWLDPKDEEDAKQPYLQVSVSYGPFPPTIYIVTKKAKSLLNEDTINILDWAEIESVDIVIRPYTWEVNNKSGVKAYVKSMYVLIAEDEFEDKYNDVPDSAANSLEHFDGR